MPSNTTTICGELEPKEQARWNFTVSECGMSFNLAAQKGNVVLYASTETTAPNEAFYQWRIEVSASSKSVAVINIIPPMGDDAVNCSSKAKINVFTTIVGVDVTNVFCVSTNGKPHNITMHFCQARVYPLL